MWNRISGKKTEATDEPISQTPRRNNEDDYPRRRSGLGKSSDTKKKASSNTTDSERVFNPTSTSYSSTSRVAYPNTAGASVASSHATASANGNDGSYTAPVLNRNQSLAEKMPRSSSSARPVRDRNDDGDRKSKSSTRSDKDEDEGKREKRSKRDKTERKSSLKNGGASRSVDGMDDQINKGPADFSQQVGSSGFQQFPGQYDGNVLGGSIAGQNGTIRPQEHAVMSSHVQDQFPGQFPSESTEPYRPPLAANEGGPGLAAEYYGDAGQSVAEQPGFRQHSPSLIIGQEPHLLPASSVAAPPPEPSASGGVGAAASFFSGESVVDEIASSHLQQTSSTHTSAPTRPDMTATSSGLSGLGGVAMGATAAIGAAAGYMMGDHSGAQEHDTVSVVGSTTEYMTASSQRPPSQAHGSHYSSSRPPGSTTSRPPKTNGRPSHADNIPIYAAAAATAAGAAGLAGSALHSNQHFSNVQASSNQQFATPTTPRHRHRGPFGALVDFVKDPDGVAKFEEYSEYVGICRGCFEPGSSPRDAPRRHRTFSRRRSDERIGRTSRVEKTRRDGSDDEKGGRKSPSWLATGLAGYGLGKMGEGLFKQSKNFDDTYSVKSGRYSPNGGEKRQEWKESNINVQRRRGSQENFEIGIIRNGKSYKSDTNGFDASASVPSRRRKSRSRSRDHKSGLAGAALGAVAGASVVSSVSRRRSHSGERIATKPTHRYREASPSERSQKARRKKKDKGFFNLGLDSSSSSVDLARPRTKKRSKGESDEKRAEAALLGLTAATAALAAADRGSTHRRNGVKELVGRKETIDDPDQRPLPEDAGWEDEEDYVSEVGSVDSGLAFGDDSDRSDDRKNERRKRSELSGKGSIPSRRSSRDNDVTAMAGAVGAGVSESELVSSAYYGPSSRQERPSPPLQYVDPMPVTDFDHLDERLATSKPFASRPPLVSRPSDDTPFHQPQPRAPVASSVYATEAPYSQTYPATAGPAEYSAPSYDAREVSSSVPDLKMRRRDTSPARIGPDVTPGELTYRRKPSAKDDASTASGVRFALPEKDDDERREKSRRKKDNRAEDVLRKERHERKGEIDRVGEPRSKQSSDQPSRRSDSPFDSSSKSWALPAAVGLAGAAVGVAAIVEDRKDSNGETKEERRERRRREKQQDEEDDEARRERRRKEKKDGVGGTPNKKERYQGDDYEESREERKARRRREREERDREDREREAEATTTPSASSHVSFGDLPQRPDRSSEDRKSSERQESPSKKEAYKHEDYSSFFTPDIDANDDQQVKISGANADADISFDQSPNFVIAEPRNLRDISGTPDISPVDNHDRVDPSVLKFPWEVPRLRLLYPTPPSTRGSTPIIEPKDVRENDIKEPSEIKSSDVSSFSEHAQEIESSNQDEVPGSEPGEVIDRFRDPPSDDDLQRLERRKPKKIPLSIDQEDAPSDPISYVDDKNFAAVLAASAEDAGFDPSIIIDNPSYRRRDSPPGSDGRNIPGSFNDEEDESDPKLSRKKKRSSRRQSPPEGRNDDAVVKDIVDQVERWEPREREAPNASDDNMDPPKSKKVKKSKKGSKRSSASEGALETQGLVDTNKNNEGQSSYEEPTGDSRSITTSTMTSKDGDNRKQPRNSKNESEAIEEAASAVAIASTVEAGKSSKSSSKKKGSIWDRVLGKSTSSLAETREAEDPKEGEPAEPLAPERQKGKKSKQPSVTTVPDDEDSKREDDTEDVSRREPEISRNTPSSAASIVQGLADDSEPKRSQEQISESFLGERPDPPPPPDISTTREGPPGVSVVYLPRDDVSRTPPEIYPGRPTEILVADIPYSPRNVSSPTAVPIHFRRPTHVRARSSSQSPLASTQNTDDISQPSRPRPRSTQFENSKEYRPLWLVERNQSRQEVPRDETYPPLPSSHSTSRDSSPPPPNEQEDAKKTERRLFGPLAEDHGLLIDTGSRAIQSEVLDSQQTTPTATSFQRTSATKEQPSPPESRSASPIHHIDVHDHHASSTLENAALATVIGGTVAFALHRGGEQDDLRDRDLHSDVPKDHPINLDDMVTSEQRTKLTDLDDQEEFAPSTKKKSKKEKKSKKRVPEELAQKLSPSTNILQGGEESFAPKSSVQHDEGASLTKEVLANEVVKVEDFTSQVPVSNVVTPKVPLVDDYIIEERLEEKESKKSKKKKKGKKNFVDLGEPLDEEPLPREETSDHKSSPQRNVDFANPFKEPPHEHFKETELSPLATPLPDDEDLDLLEEPSRSEFYDSIVPAMENVLENTGECVRHETNMEADAKDRFDVPTKKKKISKKGEQNVIGEGPPKGSKTSADSTFAYAEPTLTQVVPQEEASETPVVPLETNHGAEDDFAGFSNKKKGEKGKKGQPSTQDKLDRDPVEDSIARDTQEVPMPTEVGLMQGELQMGDSPKNDFEDQTAAPITINPSQLVRGSDDELGNLSSQKKRKKDKKRATDVRFNGAQGEELNETEPGQLVPEQPVPGQPETAKSLPEQPATGLQVDRQTLSSDEPFRDVSIEPSLSREDSYDLPPNKKESKKAKKSKKSKKAEQDDLNREQNALPQAITSTAQDVQVILSESQKDIVREPPTTSEPATIDRDLQEDPSIDPVDISEGLQKHDAPLSFTGRKDGDKARGATAAVTGTAAAVQSMLQEDSHTQAPSDRKELDPRPESDDTSVTVLAGDNNVEIRQEEKSENDRQEEPEPLYEPEKSKPVVQQGIPVFEHPADRMVEAEAIEDLPKKKFKKDKRGKISAGEKALADPEPLAAASTQVYETAPHIDDSTREGAEDDFVSFPTRPSKKDKKSKKKSPLDSTSQGPAEGLPDGMATKELEDVMESRGIYTEPTTVEATAMISETTESTIKAIPDEYHDISVKRSKKDKKKKKKDVSNDAGGDDSFDLVDESNLDQVRSIPEGGEFPKSQAVQAEASIFQPDSVERPLDVEPLTKVEQDEKWQEEELQDEPVSKPKSKKDKKKSKKAKASAWDDEIDPSPKDELPTATMEALGDSGVVESFESMPTDAQTGSGQMTKPEELRRTQEPEGVGVETFTGKKEKKKSKKAKDFSWGAFVSKEPEVEPLAASQKLQNMNLTEPPSEDQVSVTEAPEEEIERRIDDVEGDRPLQDGDDNDLVRTKRKEAEEDPVPKAKKTKKDKKKGKKGKEVSLDDMEPAKEVTADVVETPGLERAESSFNVKAYAIETPGLERNEPSFQDVPPASIPVITSVQGPQDVPEQLTFADIIEPSAIVEPREENPKHDPPQTASREPLTREMEIVDPDEDITLARGSQESKEEKTLDFRPESAGSFNYEQSRLVAQETNYEDAILIVEGHRAQEAIDPAHNFATEASPESSERGRQSVQINADANEISERPLVESFETGIREHLSEPDTPLSTGSVEMLDPEEQRKYNEEYRKQLEKELSPLREDDDMLNTEEQRNYNDDYRAELERQLSNSERADEVATPIVVPDSHEIPHPSDTHDIHEVVEQPIPSPLAATLHHTVLSDIIEEKEPRSRSGSLQDPPAEGDKKLERKKSKKGKKSKVSRQPVIYEDNTATAGLVDDAEPSTGHGESPRPINLEEPIEDERTAYTDLPSPSKGSPSISRSPKFDNGAEDYFAVKPRARAEEDVGTGTEPHHQTSISPEQAQDLPNWSSQPENHPLVAHTLGTTVKEQERPRRERSPSRERRPRKRSPSQERTQRTSSIPQIEGPITRERSGSAGEFAAAAAIGAGIAGAVALSRKESKKGKKGKQGKKNKKLEEVTQRDEEIVEPEQEEAAHDVLHKTNPNDMMEALPERFEDAPPRSPTRSAGPQRSLKDSQHGEDPKYRDSAIQIMDSPVVPTAEAVHRPQHDSGYPATDSSPVINEHGEDVQEEHEIIDPYTDPRVQTAGFYRDLDERSRSMTSDARQSIIGSDDQDMPGEGRRSRRRRRRRGSNVAYDSDDSNDSGYDKQRRRRQALMADEPREPSPVSSTTKNRSSVLFDSSPTDRQLLEEAERVSGKSPNNSIHNEQHHHEDPVIQNQETVAGQSRISEPYIAPQEPEEPRQSIFGGPMSKEALSGSASPASGDARGRRNLKNISEDNLEDSPLARKGRRGMSDIGSPDSGVKARRTSHDLSPLVTGAAAGAAVFGTDDLVRRLHKPSTDEDNHAQVMDGSGSQDQERPRRLSNQSNTSALNRDGEWRRQAVGSPDSIHAIIRTPDQVRSSSGQSLRSSGTPPLRRVDRSVSGDLRGASLKSDAKKRAKMAPDVEPAITVPSSSTYDPLTDKGKSRGDMADVYEGDGWRGDSPMSPTRPPSMRKRQSMQFADLEQRFEQLAADHRSLQNAKLVADRRVEEQARDHSQQRQVYEEAVQEHKSYLAEKDAELSRLHVILDGFKRQVSELTSVNEELQTSHGLDPDRMGDQSFQILAGQHDTTKRELEGLREQHSRLAKDHENILEREIDAVRQEKDYELQQLQEELESAKEQVRALQQQIVASRSVDDYIEHDEDYFESKCTALCQHVQQWVLRFSKFSDTHACRLVGDLNDDVLADLYDDAILDGTEADDYLQDRILRRDVFMSVVMSRLFDFVFRRYLFGLDRDHRKKLKDLDATLSQVGPAHAVHKWRSTTLHLLSSRPEFADQRDEDTDGVVDSIFHTLAAILPPKKDLIPQITSSLRRVVAMAVDLHIEMRLQRAEFQMLPPLKPQFDPATGDLTRKVPFNATMMNERSGDKDVDNERLQEEGAVVRMVLFPLVVKNGGGDVGEGEEDEEGEQIVVCPAQVLVAKDEGEGKRKGNGNGNGKQVRVVSAQGGRSEVSFAGTEGAEGGMF